MIELAIIGYIIGLIGVVNFMDGLYSLLLYLGKPSWRQDVARTYNPMPGVYSSSPVSPAEPQTWKKDHWVRIVRMALGLSVILLGGMLIWFGVRL